MKAFVVHPKDYILLWHCYWVGQQMIKSPAISFVISHFHVVYLSLYFSCTYTNVYPSLYIY